MMASVSDDSRAKRRQRDYVIEQIETVPMTAEQYDRAVNALATLIVKWAQGRRRPRHYDARSFRGGLTSRRHGWVSIRGSFGSHDRDERPRAGRADVQVLAEGLG